MTPTMRTLVRLLWIPPLLLAFTFLAIWIGTSFSAPSDESPAASVIPDFALTDQNGKTFPARQLRGHVWIAAFIFTRCNGPCPAITRNLRDLQQSIPNPKVQFVAFSVDPVHDTPAVLQAYARNTSTNGIRWHFLTGDSAVISQVARAMELAILPASATAPIVHSTKLVLVDPQMRIAGYYDGTDPKSLDRLATDASTLAGYIP